jgi:PAS domain-containing protein
MKRIALMTNRRDPKLGEILIKDLEEVLGGRAEIRGVFFESLKAKELIDADAVLVTIPSKALEVRTHVAEARRILVMQRTIRAEDAVRISAIPAGTKVLVVNNLPETTMEMVALLQQMEFNHLEFIPFEEGMDCSDIRVAITPGETARVPEAIPKVIDVGHRRIDISTFIELIGRLRIADREVDRRLYRYSENNVNLDMGVNRQYRELFVKNTELDTVINLAHEGILLLNAKGRIALYNQPLAEMLSIAKDLTGASLAAFPLEVQEALAQDQSLLEYKGRSLIVTREEIAHFGVPEGTCFNVQEVTYIRQLEQNLSRKLREKGLTARYTFDDVKTWSPRMRACIDLARRIAKSEFTVLITGESGTGKELIAQSIHNESPRNIQPFVAVNCAAVPENLLESELFGYEGGSFTGALKEGKAGLFEQANNGTVFLDEIGDIDRKSVV